MAEKKQVNKTNNKDVKKVENEKKDSKLKINKVNVKEKDSRNKKKRNKSLNKNKKNFKGTFTLDILDLLIIIVIVSIFSCLTTGLILSWRYKDMYSGYDSNLVSDENLSTFVKAYSEVVDNFYEEVDSKGMIEAALSGMMSYLEDNYSIYMNNEDSGDLSSMLESSYEGIGTNALKNKVVQVYKDSPADVAGIKVNDVIIEINGTKIDENNYYLMSDYLFSDGKENTIVVDRDGEELEFVVKKDKVEVPVVYTEVLEKEEKNIGYISLSQFSTKSTSEFENGLSELEKDNIDSLIIDLRDNSGGYLKSANEISSLFLKKGKVIYSLESKNEIEEYLDETNTSRNYPVVVLVNSGTASASEILAAALKDSYGAMIVGNVTFGKGKVQNLMYYNDSIVKYTSAKWLRPNGECVDQIGITPDYLVSITVKNNVIYDNQLEKAVELLS